MKRTYLAVGLFLVATCSISHADKQGFTEADRNIDKFCRLQSKGSSEKFSECKKDSVVGMVGLQVLSSGSNDPEYKELINRCVEMNYIKQGMVNWEEAYECVKRH